jgi:hypothetical protein
MKRFFQLKRQWIAPILLVSLMACSGLQTAPPPESQEERLKKRATEYWQHRIAERTDQAYAYEDARLRKDLSLPAYVRNVGGGINWMEADIQKVVIDGNRGEVTMTIRFINTMANYIPKEGRKKTITDHWVFEENDWYHLIGTRK